MEKPLHKYLFLQFSSNYLKKIVEIKKNKDSAQKFKIKQRIINDTANHRVYYVVLADNKLSQLLRFCTLSRRLRNKEQ